MAGLALLEHDRPAAPDPRRPLRGRDAERHRAGHLVPRLPPPRPAHGADPPPLRGRRLARVHGDRAVLAVRRRVRGARRSASSTPTSSTSPGSSTDAASLVLGPRRHRRRRRALGAQPRRRRRRVVDDRPRRRVGRAPAAVAARRSASRCVAAAGRADARRARRARLDLVVPSPGVPERHPLAPGRARAPACRCAPRSTSPPRSLAATPAAALVAVTGTNGKTTVTS